MPTWSSFADLTLPNVGVPGLGRSVGKPVYEGSRLVAAEVPTQRGVVVALLLLASNPQSQAHRPFASPCPRR